MLPLARPHLLAVGGGLRVYRQCRQFFFPCVFANVGGSSRLGVFHSSTVQQRRVASFAFSWFQRRSAGSCFIDYLGFLGFESSLPLFRLFFTWVVSFLLLLQVLDMVFFLILCDLGALQCLLPGCGLFFLT